MATKLLSNASSTDNLLANDHLEIENQQCTCESSSQNDGNEGTITVQTASQRTKPSVQCTWERVMIAVMFVALAVVTVAFSIYVGELHHRVDRLEMVSNSVGTSFTINKTQLNSSLDTEDGDLSDLSMELEGVKGNVSILENMLTELNNSLSSSQLFFTNETASNDIMFSDLQRSLGLIEGDLALAKTRLQNLSSVYINHLSDYDATVHNIYTIRTVLERNISQLYDLVSGVEHNHSLSMSQLYDLIHQVESNHSLNMSQLYDLIHQVESNHSLNMSQLYNLIHQAESNHSLNISQLYDLIHQVDSNHSLNMSHLYDLIHQVESNHSFILEEYSRILDKAALNRSVLTHRIDDTFNLVGSQGQIISGIRSNISSIESRLAGLCGKLTAKVQHLDDQVGRIQRNLSDQWQRLNRFDDQLDEIELIYLLSLGKDEAIRIVPFEFLLLSAISFLVSYTIL